jgi:serine/threonine-protein kinase
MPVGLESGTIVGGYRIERPLGRGGMGAVYVAVHERLGRSVALKVLPPELAADPGFRARFLRECEAVARLEHPHIVPIYDAGESADGMLYLAMRLVPGGDLKALIATYGHLTPEHTLMIVEQIAAALDAAHLAGVVHRDVKPANILLDDSGRHAYLADFGLAKSLAGEGLTRTGSFLGSVDYCAPEQINGRPLDGRADVYALGGVLYHCLVGQPPYVRATEAAVVTAHVTDPPPALARVRPDLPHALDGVIVTAMAKHPEVRYDTAGELARAVREAVFGAPRGAAPPERPTVVTPRAAAPTVYQPAPAGPPSPRAASGSRTALLVGTVALGALALGVAAVVALTRGGSTPATTSSSAPTTASVATPDAAARERRLVAQLEPLVRTSKRAHVLLGAAVRNCSSPAGLQKLEQVVALREEILAATRTLPADPVVEQLASAMQASLAANRARLAYWPAHPGACASYVTPADNRATAAKAAFASLFDRLAARTGDAPVGDPGAL